MQSVVVHAVDWKQCQWPLFLALISPVFFHVLPPPPPPMSTTFLIEGVLASKKTYWAKVEGSAKKSRVRHLSRPRQPFLIHREAILDVAGSDRVPPAPMGWYFFLFPSQPFLIEWLLGSKNLFSKSCRERWNTLRLNNFSNSVSFLCLHCGHFGFCISLPLGFYGETFWS